jgi:pilus assembly protein FimV
MALKRWQFIAGIVCLVGATAVSALSLGRVRGAPLIGRSLDLTVLATLDVQEATPEANCFAVEVFYGDSRVSPNSISVSPERLAGGELRLRVRSSVVVDEPVVTLYVRTSCGTSLSRRFVLLADAVNDTEQSSAAPTLVLPPFASARISLAPSGQSAGGSTSNLNAAEQRAASRQAARLERQRAARERADLPPVASAQRPSVMRNAEKAKDNASRLQVDLLDLTSTNLNLRGSLELGSAPATDENVRRQAQALWRTLNASPEETMLDVQRLQEIDTQLRATIGKSQQQSKDIASLTTELEIAKRERYLNPLTIFLGLLSLAALGLCLWLWRHNIGSSQPWWGSKSVKTGPKDEEHLWDHLADSEMAGLKEDKLKASTLLPSGVSIPAPLNDMKRSGFQVSKPPQENLRFSDKPGSLPGVKSVAYPSGASKTKAQESDALASTFSGGSMGGAGITTPTSYSTQVPKQADFKRSFPPSDFAASAYSGRVVAAEELFDIQEQADFFMSLDQPDQAIEVLKNHITDNVETSALAYMDLFDIYHRTGREADYSELREEFNRVFNAQVPVFAQYGGLSAGLEGFPHVLASIQDAWGRPFDALSFIEDSIFRKPDEDQPPLDMNAYRELMLLYSLAKELAQSPSGMSMLPTSRQIPLQDVGDSSQMMDVELDDNVGFSSPKPELIKGDPTVSIPAGQFEKSGLKLDDNSLDFDLNNMNQLKDGITFPGLKKKV